MATEGGKCLPNASAISESPSIEVDVAARESPSLDMDIEAKPVESEPLQTTKRPREDEEGQDDASPAGESKKSKADTSVEEERLEKLTGEGNVEQMEEEEEEDNDGEKEGKEEDEKKVDASLPVKLGPKKFDSSVEMFDYFFKFLHFWPPNVDVNKYEHMIFLDLLLKGCSDAEKKIGSGVRSFQVRYHPEWRSRCFFLARTDGSYDDFSYRKAIDHIIPLPENMKTPAGSGVDKKAGNKNSGGRRGGGGGRGRGRFGHGRGRGRN